MENKKVIKKRKTENKKSVLKTVKKAETKISNVKKVTVKKEMKSVKGSLLGTVVSTKMQKTIVVAITRKVAHKKYGKLIKITKRLKVDTNGMEFSEGDNVVIQMTRPMSNGKNYKVIRKEEVA